MCAQLAVVFLTNRKPGKNEKRTSLGRCRASRIEAGNSSLSWSPIWENVPETTVNIPSFRPSFCIIIIMFFLLSFFLIFSNSFRFFVTPQNKIQRFFRALKIHGTMKKLSILSDYLDISNESSFILLFIEWITFVKSATNYFHVLRVQTFWETTHTKTLDSLDRQNPCWPFHSNKKIWLFDSDNSHEEISSCSPHLVTLQIWFVGACEKLLERLTTRFTFPAVCSRAYSRELKNLYYENKNSRFALEIWRLCCLS